MCSIIIQKQTKAKYVEFDAHSFPEALVFLRVISQDLMH